VSELPDERAPFLVKLADGVLTLSFNRPEHRNAMPSQAVPQLERVFRETATNPEARVLLIRAEGANFGGGGDVQGMQLSLAKSSAGRREEYHARLERGRSMVRAFCELEIPVIAACRGSVAGLAMLYPLGADIVLADESAFFVCAHQQVGLTPDGGISYLLPRVVGVKKALDLILTARRVGADEALAIGLVSRLVPATDLEAEALKQAQRLAQAPQRVLRAAKAMVKHSLDTDLDSQLCKERDRVVQCVTEPDFDEGVTAFLEKRRPKFPSAS
jgi:2-(1,2-epoxy-1,2-dihydrophenyl)acetyl-CoA isomerase